MRDIWILRNLWLIFIPVFLVFVVWSNFESIASIASIASINILSFFELIHNNIRFMFKGGPYGRRYMRRANVQQGEEASDELFPDLLSRPLSDEEKAKLLDEMYEKHLSNQEYYQGLGHLTTVIVINSLLLLKVLLAPYISLLIFILFRWMGFFIEIRKEFILKNKLFFLKNKKKKFKKLIVSKYRKKFGFQLQKWKREK